MTLSNQAKIALNLFNTHLGQIVSRQQIIDVTRWAEKTVDTYISKKWLNTILVPIDSDHYKVNLDKALSEEEFDDLQTQVDQRVRT